MEDEIIIPTGKYIARDGYDENLTIFTHEPEYIEEEEGWFLKKEDRENGGDTEVLAFIDFPMVKTEDGPYEILLRKVH